MKHAQRRLFLALFTSFALPITIEAQDSGQTGSEDEKTEASVSPVDSENTAKIPKVRTAPNTEQKRVQDLKAQYPPQELRRINSSAGEFTALWKKGRTGTTFGALLIVPTDGQTANWPHTIETLRSELPQTGWSTLSIDIEAQAQAKPPKRSQHASEAVLSEEQTDTSDTLPNESNNESDPNRERIKAAIEFLHSEGQYNIVLAGYGNSAKRVLEYAQENGATGMSKNMKSNVTQNMQRPIRAMIMVNPKSSRGEDIETLINTITFTDMPMLDVIVGRHYIDTHGAEARKQSAMDAGIDTYLQVQLMEPSTVVFGKENRLSRRIRGFLTKYAKGVEIGKGS